MAETTNVVYEEDIEKMCQTVKKLFGPVGRMLYPHMSKNVLRDAKVYIPEFGIVWYGDLERDKAPDMVGALLLEEFFQTHKIKEVEIKYAN